MDDDLPDHPPPTALQRLSQLSERPQGQLNHAYSRRVRQLRLILPVLALGIVAVLFLWPQMDQIKPAPAADTAAPAKKTGSNELIHPKFQGQDNNNQPYSVTADSAVQSADDPDTVLLVRPRGQAAFADGGAVTVEAAKGAYRQKARRLTLDTDVRLATDSGYHLDGRRATIDMDARRAWSDLPVAGAGPAGTITATGLQADTATGVLIFTGPATLVLNHALKGL